MLATRLAWVGLMLVAGAAHAPGADFPVYEPGQRDVVFDKMSPETTDEEVQGRMGRDDRPPDYDITQEKFRVWGPKAYTHKAPWGLFVWIDSGPTPSISPDWEPLLASHKLLAVGAYDSGNQRSTYDRYRLAVDAVHNMRERYNIDPKRVYISGSSGGGRVASELGVAYGDVFTGAFPIIGANFYKAVPSGKGESAWPPTYKPLAKVLTTAKKRNRYVLLTGEKDFNRENTRRVHRLGFKAEGFRRTLYLEVPKMSHQRPPADWFAKGLDFLE